MNADSVAPHNASSQKDRLGDPEQHQRVAAYAIILRGQGAEREILLTRLAQRVTPQEMWILPGGGIEFGEHPAVAVAREVHEETGLHAEVGSPLWIGSQRRFTEEGADWHSLRLVFEAAVAEDSPEPRVLESHGSTMDARWHRLAEVKLHGLPVSQWVVEVLTHIE